MFARFWPWPWAWRSFPAAVAEEEAKTPAAKPPAAKTSSAKTPATKTAAAKTSSAKASSADAAPAADFATLYKGWKQRMARMYQIQQLYKNDASADKEALLAEFNDIMEKAQDELPPVLAAGEKEYLAAPNKNKELNSFLFTNLLGFVQADDFEKAAKLARLLTEHDFEAPQFNLLAGVSFFAVNDYENAEKYLKLANDSQQITRPAQQYLEQIETYKEKWAKEQKLRRSRKKRTTCRGSSSKRPRETLSSNCSKTKPPIPWPTSSASSRRSFMTA